MKKRLGLALAVFVTAATILLIANFASAQSYPKPAAPQFSIKVVDYSYDVPTTYYTDPYSGKQVANTGYHVEDVRIEGDIKNQHFTPYTMANPNSTSSNDANRNIDFYYDIRFKGHFGEKWINLYGSEDYEFLKQEYGNQFTNFTVSKYNSFLNFQEGGQVDFQVRAVVGYESWEFAQTWPYRALNGEFGDWSQTLTITISSDTTNSSTRASSIDGSAYPVLAAQQASPTATISPTSIVPELSATAVIILLFAVITPVIAAKKFVLKEGRKT